MKKKMSTTMMIAVTVIKVNGANWPDGCRAGKSAVHPWIGK